MDVRTKGVCWAFVAHIFCRSACSLQKVPSCFTSLYWGFNCCIVSSWNNIFCNATFWHKLPCTLWLFACSHCLLSCCVIPSVPVQGNAKFLSRNCWLSCRLKLARLSYLPWRTLWFLSRSIQIWDLSSIAMYIYVQVHFICRDIDVKIKTSSIESIS